MVVVMLVAMIVVVAMAVQISAVSRDDTARVRNGAVHVFQLNSGVVKMEAVAKDPVQAVQDALALGMGHVVDKHMAA
jgi:hypothetical protein